jgi:hypothetical protein
VKRCVGPCFIPSVKADQSANWRRLGPYHLQLYCRIHKHLDQCSLRYGTSYRNTRDFPLLAREADVHRLHQSRTPLRASLEMHIGQMRCSTVCLTLGSLESASPRQSSMRCWGTILRWVSDIPDIISTLISEVAPLSCWHLAYPLTIF